MIRILFNEGDDNQLEERESDIKLSIMLTQLYNSIRIIKLGLYDDGNGKQSRDELIICMGNVRINEVKAKFYPLNKFDAYNRRVGLIFLPSLIASIISLITSSLSLFFAILSSPRSFCYPDYSI